MTLRLKDSMADKEVKAKLDGFHARCLRVILRIKPSFISRVSNARVLQVAHRKPLSQEIRRAQLQLLGRVLHEPHKSVLKTSAFHNNTLTPATDVWIRRVGRPRQEWTTQLCNVMRRAAGDHVAWLAAADCQSSWNHTVNMACGD